MIRGKDQRPLGAPVTADRTHPRPRPRAVNELCMDSRPTAVLVGQRWLDAGVFYHVSRSEPFSDSEALFRFGQDEITTLLNMKAVASGPAQGVDVVVRNLQGAMHACVR